VKNNYDEKSDFWAYLAALSKIVFRTPPVSPLGKYPSASCFVINGEWCARNYFGTAPSLQGEFVYGQSKCDPSMRRFMNECDVAIDLSSGERRLLSKATPR
jgi:hypothetical protein